nr:hypothetical protein [Tanacetum cinerariifolium]
NKTVFLMIDYFLWEVILYGDSPIPTRVVDGVVQPVAPTTAEQRLAKKNELNARGTLSMALLDKHQLKFNIHKDAKTLLKQQFRVDVVEDFKEYTLRDYYCWLKTYCCWYKLKLLDNAAHSRLRLLEENVVVDEKMKKLL